MLDNGLTLGIRKKFRGHTKPAFCADFRVRARIPLAQNGRLSDDRGL